MGMFFFINGNYGNVYYAAENLFVWQGSKLSKIIPTYPHIVQNIHGNCLVLIKNKTSPKGCDTISITAIIAELYHGKIKKRSTTRHDNERMIHLNTLIFFNGHNLSWHNTFLLLTYPSMIVTTSLSTIITTVIVFLFFFPGL